MFEQLESQAVEKQEEPNGGNQNSEPSLSPEAFLLTFFEARADYAAKSAAIDGSRIELRKFANFSNVFTALLHFCS